MESTSTKFVCRITFVYFTRFFFFLQGHFQACFVKITKFIQNAESICLYRMILGKITKRKWGRAFEECGLFVNRPYKNRKSNSFLSKTEGLCTAYDAKLIVKNDKAKRRPAERPIS